MKRLIQYLPLLFLASSLTAYGDERARTSNVDFSNCLEFAGGVPVSLAGLQQQVPDDIPVKSLTDLGFVFPGSDDLGVLIVRALRCDEIAVEFQSGGFARDLDRSLVHVGTPIFVDNLPPTPFSLDGNNGADFNNFTFRYYTDSRAFQKALRRGGFSNVTRSQRITFEDLDTDATQCGTAIRLIDVAGSDAFSIKVAGQVTEANAACHVGTTDVVANWWNVQGRTVAATSNQIISQTLLTTVPETLLLVTEPDSVLGAITGGRVSTFSAFAFSGFIPSPEDVDMVIGPVGTR